MSNDPINLTDPYGLIAEETNKNEIEKEKRQKEIDKKTKEMMKKGKQDPTKGTKGEVGKKPKPKMKIPKPGKKSFCDKFLKSCLGVAARCPWLPGKVIIGIGCIGGYVTCVLIWLLIFNFELGSMKVLLKDKEF